MVRCPVLEMGRNSVKPSTAPSSTASKMFKPDLVP
jgi:hypothetical protein